jgi:hypothetical protein
MKDLFFIRVLTGFYVSTTKQGYTTAEVYGYCTTGSTNLTQYKQLQHFIEIYYVHKLDNTEYNHFYIYYFTKHN